MTQQRIAALFDIDGTLVDSNYLHVEAWQHAFRTMGQPVDAWRIHRSIGQDGDQLISSLVGERDPEWVSRATELNAEYYEQLAPRLRTFAAARELLETLADRGVAVVLATSAPDTELQMLLRVIDADAAIHATTNADDVDTAKPEPDIVNIALERAGVPAERAFFVGDSVWDMVAATRAGIAAYGVLSGGISSDMLTDAGALATFDDPADLLQHLHELPLLG